ncbi:LysM peptidoglycan-binding domain-containing protein [Streptococcus sp. HF-1907]|uniref:LysM peptidoglycan-binding domain-containing protein n=1 Tax=Streptococcus sp. HF-1907 TaxID=2785793 RepID=UPI00189D6235|nr:LysM domain-containing protein [Streptococcus sp. HF-1907]MBF7094009.1 LysM peptidoglycan-binding domain-containing protein [Streptococcus sp. HF-1907]
MKKKNYVSKALMFGALLAPIGMPTVSVLADSFYQNQTSAHAADITNWIASTPEQITNNLTTQNINPKQLNGQQYVIQWGDTLWGISQATGISVEKLAYDNNIQNIDLIYAGDVLILNRDGQVPTDYHVTGSGHRCANSKVVINNYYGDHNRVVIKNTTFVSDDHSKNTVIYAPDNSDNSLSFSNTNNNSGDKDTKDSKDSKDSSSSSSESKESKDASSSTESSKEKELSDDAFQDKVQSEFEQVYQQKRSGSRPAWSFFSHVTDTAGGNTEDKKDAESTALYRQGETPKAEDIVDGPKDGAKTESNAKALAEKIYDALNRDSKMSDLIKAKYAQIKVTYQRDKWTFNIDVYKEKESSSSSSEKSSESKNSSNDDSQTESRMSSSSSSHSDSDSDATFDDLNGDN